MTKYKCEKCGKQFERRIKIGRFIRCDSCKTRQTHHRVEITTIFDLSNRTIRKLLKRASAKCSLCGYDDSTPNLHHIEHRKNGGSDQADNLILVCPNHHAEIHEYSDRFEVAFLRSFSIERTFPDWKSYYNVTPVKKQKRVGDRTG